MKFKKTKDIIAQIVGIRIFYIHPKLFNTSKRLITTNRLLKTTQGIISFQEMLSFGEFF